MLNAVAANTRTVLVLITDAVRAKRPLTHDALYRAVKDMMLIKSHVDLETLLKELYDHNIVERSKVMVLKATVEEVDAAVKTFKEEHNGLLVW